MSRSLGRSPDTSNARMLVPQLFDPGLPQAMASLEGAATVEVHPLAAGGVRRWIEATRRRLGDLGGELQRALDQADQRFEELVGAAARSPAANPERLVCYLLAGAAGPLVRSVSPPEGPGPDELGIGILVGRAPTLLRAGLRRDGLVWVRSAKGALELLEGCRLDEALELVFGSRAFIAADVGDRVGAVAGVLRELPAAGDAVIVSPEVKDYVAACQRAVDRFVSRAEAEVRAVVDGVDAVTSVVAQRIAGVRRLLPGKVAMDDQLRGVTSREAVLPSDHQASPAEVDAIDAAGPDVPAPEVWPRVFDAYTDRTCRRLEGGPGTLNSGFDPEPCAEWLALFRLGPALHASATQRAYHARCDAHDALVRSAIRRWLAGYERFGRRADRPGRRGAPRTYDETFTGRVDRVTGTRVPTLSEVRSLTRD